MNSIEYKMIELLKDLKKNYSVCELKVEFEAEGSRINEVMRLKEIAEKSGLGLVFKIGGCEAITDMYEAQKIGVTGIIAPMIESPYAMKKYLQAIEKYFSESSRKDIHFGSMIERTQGYKNISDILDAKKLFFIDTLSVGRVDMGGSLGISKYDLNGEKIYKIVEDIFSKGKKKGLRTVMGGGIAKEAIPFIKKLISKKLLNRYETRKIIFTAVDSSAAHMEDGIIKANLFELFWLQSKKNYYTNIYLEDDARIEMLMSRIYKINA